VKNEQLERAATTFHKEAPADRAAAASTPFYDLFRVDLDTFNLIFSHTTPWGRGQKTAPSLAKRAFRLMDRNGDGLISFRELVEVLDVVCRGDQLRKLRLFYALHLPHVVLPGELPNERVNPRPAVDQTDVQQGEDVAVEAADFFSEEARRPDEVDSEANDVDQPLAVDDYVRRQEAVQGIRRWLFSPSSSPEHKTSPPSLPEENLVLLWHALNDMFEADGQQSTLSAFEGGDADELQHSVTMAGTLLLRTGEVNQQRMQKELGGSGVPVEWSVTFEQFLANFMNEAPLADYFDRKVDLLEGLAALSASRLRRGGQDEPA